jgi:NodT family efflux transporter outer membrane factor (OMF) lipoprotein
MIRASTVASLALLLTLASCALKPEPKGESVRAEMLANVKMPPKWAEEAAASESVNNGWLENFADPQLRSLIIEALAYNTDLIVAAARVEQAAAYARVAGGERYPAMRIAGRAGAEVSGDDTGLQGLIASASWEIDVWGRVRYGVRSSKDQREATRADYVYARQSLIGLVSQAWFLAIEATLKRVLADQMVEASVKLLELAVSRSQIGAGSQLDVALARGTLQSYQDDALQAQFARVQSLRALEVLLGRYPAAEISVAARFPGLGPDVPVGLPAELLERRPDVIAAQWRIGAAFNRLQQARAARLPSITLTGSGSDLSSDLFVLQDRDNPVWSVGGKVLAPLFSGGALKAQVAVRTAEQRQAMAAYASAVLNAFNEVEDALSNESTLRSRELVLAATVADAERALHLSQTRYQVGSQDLRSVRQQELAMYAAQMNLLHVQAARRIQRVHLHLAVGGDFAAQ